MTSLPTSVSGKFTPLISRLFAEEIDFEATIDFEPPKYLKLDFDIYRCNKVWSKSLDAHSGSYRTFPFLCGHFSHNEYGLFCPRCLNLRINEIRERIMRAVMESGIVQIAELSPKAAQTLLCNMDTFNYLRCPQANGLIRVFYKSERANNPLTLANLDELDWTLIAQTPENERVSGDLGKQKDKKKVRKKKGGTGGSSDSEQDDEDSEPVIITGAEVVTENLDSAQEKMALEQSLAAIANQLPSTPNEVERVLHTWADIFARLVRERGGRAMIYRRHVKVYPDQIDWVQFNSIKNPASIMELNYIGPPN